MRIFKKKKYGVINVPFIDNKDIPIVPDGAWVKCDHCGKILYKKNLEENYYMCNNCNHYFRLSAHDRINLICDQDSFIEFNRNMETNNPMKFPGYERKVNQKALEQYLSFQYSPLEETFFKGIYKLMPGHMLLYKNGSYGGINLGNLVDVVSDNESLRSNSQLNAEYIQQVMESRMEEITLKEGITDETILTLVEGGQKATIENIVSAMQLSVPGSEFRKYLMETEERRDAAENLLEHFDDEESALEAVKELKNSVLPEKQGNGIDISYEKMKAAADISGNLRFMVRSAKNQTYHIPMDLDGEAVTVRVSFVKNEGEGNVNISMNSQSFGKIDCVIHSVNMVSNVKTEAVIYCENVQTADGIIANRQIFIREAQNIDPSGMYELNVLRKKSENYGKQDNKTAAYKIQNSRDVQNSKVETAYLYKISKSFLKSVKECLKNSR